MQNLECVTPSWIHRTNNSGEGASPPKPPTSAPVFCMSDMADVSWMCCDPRRLPQVVKLSPDQVEQAYLKAATLAERVRTKVRRSGAAAWSVSWLERVSSDLDYFGTPGCRRDCHELYLTLFITSLPAILPIRPVLILPSSVDSRS